MARRPIALGDMKEFELDDDGRLYWQGDRVLTEVRLAIPKAVSIAAIAAGFSTVGIFLLAAAQALGWL